LTINKAGNKVLKVPQTIPKLIKAVVM